MRSSIPSPTLTAPLQCPLLWSVGASCNWSNHNDCRSKTKTCQKKHKKKIREKKRKQAISKNCCSNCCPVVQVSAAAAAAAGYSFGPPPYFFLYFLFSCFTLFCRWSCHSRLFLFSTSRLLFGPQSMCAWSWLRLSFSLLFLSIFFLFFVPVSSIVVCGQSGPLLFWVPELIT